MPRCEMCGTEQKSLTTVKISQAELEVCDNCVDMGTTVSSEESGDAAETKYSTTASQSENSSSQSKSSQATETDSQSSTSPSMDTDTLRADYGEVIRNARESEGQTLADLAEAVGEKESHIRRIEQGDRRPTETLQHKLENTLDIELGADSEFDVEEYGGDGTGQTLGDVVNFNN